MLMNKLKLIKYQMSFLYFKKIHQNKCNFIFLFILVCKLIFLYLKYQKKRNLIWLKIIKNNYFMMKKINNN